MAQTEKDDGEVEQKDLKEMSVEEFHQAPRERWKKFREVSMDDLWRGMGALQIAMESMELDKGMEDAEVC